MTQKIHTPTVAVMVVFSIAAASGIGCSESQAQTVQGLMLDAGSGSVEGHSARRITVTSRSPEAIAWFEKARPLLETENISDAAPLLANALQADPDFAFALAYYGLHQPGPEGASASKRSLELSRQLPEGERLFIEYLSDAREGSSDKLEASMKELLRVARDDWHVAFAVGDQARHLRNWPLAASAYKKAVEQVHTCMAYNNLAYTQAMLNRYDLGILALQKCIALSPNEANPHDSLGELQLAGGNLDDAEQSFRDSLRIDPNFAAGWSGLATVMFLKGKSAEGHAAIASGRSVAGTLERRCQYDVLEAWALLAEGKGDAAVRIMERDEKVAYALGAAGLADSVWATITRSALLHEQGKDFAAEQAAELALKRLNSAELPGQLTIDLRRRARVREVLAEAGQKQWAAVDRSITSLEDEQVGGKPTPEIEQARRLIHAVGALGRDDAPLAVRELRQCPLPALSDWSYDHRRKPEELYCSWVLLQAQERLHDTVGAQKTRGELVNRFSREPMAYYFRKKLIAAP